MYESLRVWLTDDRACMSSYLGVYYVCIGSRSIQITRKILQSKKYLNWNVWFSCGFDVEDGHTSKTCPAPWRHANHQEGFDMNNAGQYIGAGYDACTKAMHKSQLPNL